MKNVHTLLSACIYSMIGLTMRAQAMLDVHLPRVWDAAFITLVAELAPTKDVLITVFRNNDNFIIGMSISDSPGKWYSFQKDRGRLKKVDPKEIKETLGDKYATATYHGKVYTPVEGFGRHISVMVEDPDR